VDPILAEAIERSRRGDTAAFGAVVEALGPAIVRFVASILGGDVHAAHDVAQDTFLAAWKALPRLDQPHHLKPWCFQVAYHHAISWIRRRGPRGEPFREIVDVERPEPPPPRPFRVKGHAAQGDPAPYVRAALASLPARYVAPLTLCYLEGLGARGTAELLGVPLSTIKMRLHRGRALLREVLLTSSDRWERDRRPRAPAPATKPANDAGVLRNECAPPNGSAAPIARDAPPTAAPPPPAAPSAPGSGPAPAPAPTPRPATTTSRAGEITP